MILFTETFDDILIESAKSDKYEKDVATSINKIAGVTAERPKVSTAYSDVLLTLDGGEKTWLEVKMNHTDNLSNPRIFFDGKKWDTTYHTSAAAKAVSIMNKSNEAKDFLKAIAKYSGIENPTIPTTKRGLKEDTAVPLFLMKEYFDQPGLNRYITTVPDVDLGKVVTDHYTTGKAEPAYYMQAGDDFYMLTTTNPFNLPKDIPVLKGKGAFKVRIATRSEFYEVQAEIKITTLAPSKYSLKPGTKKKNPFKGIS